MTRTMMIFLTAASFALAGCDGMTSDQRMVTGALAGGAVGLAAGDALGGGGTGRAVGTLAGAAAGAAIGAQSAKMCRYSDGHVAPCPAGY